MESATRSRKRKQRSSKSDHFGGVFTRSKSQIHFHRHRSGYARADSSRSRNVIHSLVAKQQQSAAKVNNNNNKHNRNNDDEDQVTNQSSVKDLRLRRVFSPTDNDVVSIGDEASDCKVIEYANPNFSDLGVSNDVIVALGDADDNVVSVGDVNLEASDCNTNPNLSDLGISDDVIVALGDADDNVVSIGVVNLEGSDCKIIDDANPSLSDLGVSNDFGVSDREKDVVVALGDADDVVQMRENVVGFEKNEEVGKKNDVMEVIQVIEKVKRNAEVDEKIGMVSVRNEGVDANSAVNKSQSMVQSLKGRRKVFKSPSSFSYRRLLPYLKDMGNDDSSSFEIVDAKSPEQTQKSSTNVPKIVASNNQEAGGAFSNVKSCERQYSNIGNPELARTVELSDVVQKNNEVVINDALEESVQMTPPDLDIYSKMKVDKNLGVLAKPTSKLVLDPCSRMTILQTPTSFSHRRLLPFLMSVAGDNSCASKGNQSLILEKALDHNQQQPSLSPHQNISVDESNTDGTSGQMSTADDKSDSPTSTLIPIDTSFDIINTVTPVSNDNVLDIHRADKECSGSTLQMEVESQAKQIDGSIKMEQASPKNNLKSVEESSRAIETLPRILTEQSINNNDDFTGIRSNYSGENKTPVNVSVQHSLLQLTPVHAPRVNGEIIKTGILKRTPRGCRGICNCLNCTSFRLHAERSFEFSRNQMHDAEEVALELINDLTSLRKLLESTGSGSASLSIEKEQQVKEACEKAMYKEAVAKARLAQMNEDLSFHCRSMNLSRPKVTFANKVEEKVYSKGVVFGKKRV